MIHNPNAIIVPSLPYSLNSTSLHEQHVVQEVCAEHGITMLPLLEIPSFPESSADSRPTYRQEVIARAKSHADLIASADVLVVPNAETEYIQDGEQRYEVPFSVGRFALTMMSLANQIYGEGSGRVFLSQDLPIVGQLAEVTSKRRVVNAARIRLLSVGPLKPVVLNGDYAPMIAKAKTPRARGGTTR